MSLCPLGCERTYRNVYLHVPFITIIGVVKVDRLWARCNVALACFFMDYRSLGVKNIGLGARCHLDPRDPPTSPSPAPSSMLLHRWCARLPPFTSDLHLFPLAAFIYWGTSHLAHISKGTRTLCCTVVFNGELHGNKVAGFVSVWQAEKNYLSFT